MQSLTYTTVYDIDNSWATVTALCEYRHIVTQCTTSSQNKGT